jgi:hypothetical protein
MHNDRSLERLYNANAFQCSRAAPARSTRTNARTTQIRAQSPEAYTHTDGHRRLPLQDIPLPALRVTPRNAQRIRASSSSQPTLVFIVRLVI